MSAHRNAVPTIPRLKEQAKRHAKSRGITLSEAKHEIANIYDCPNWQTLKGVSAKSANGRSFGDFLRRTFFKFQSFLSMDATPESLRRVEAEFRNDKPYNVDMYTTVCVRAKIDNAKDVREACKSATEKLAEYISAVNWDVPEGIEMIVPQEEPPQEFAIERADEEDPSRSYIPLAYVEEETIFDHAYAPEKDDELYEARYIGGVDILDPDVDAEVNLAIYKDPTSNGMFGIDSSFLEQCFDDDEDIVVDSPINPGTKLRLNDEEPGLIGEENIPNIKLQPGQKLMKCTWPHLPEFNHVGVATELPNDVWSFEPLKPCGRDLCFLTLNELEEVPSKNIGTASPEENTPGWKLDLDYLDPNDYDAVEVAPCIDTDGNGNMERCENLEPGEKADLWSVYFHCIEGGCECVADFATEDEAISYAEELEKLLEKQGSLKHRTYTEEPKVEVKNPKMAKVFTLVITHRHGENVYTEPSYEKAMQELYQYVCEEWWEVVEKFDVEQDKAPEDMDEAIRIYFEAWSESSSPEDWEIFESTMEIEDDADNDNDVENDHDDSEVDTDDVACCLNCDADLTRTRSVEREYVDKDGGESVCCDGHYDENGYFEADEGVNLSEGRYDLLDDSDKCAACGYLL